MFLKTQNVLKWQRTADTFTTLNLAVLFTFLVLLEVKPLEISHMVFLKCVYNKYFLATILVHRIKV